VTEHKVVGYGSWCNDNSADLVLWCSTCNTEVASFNSYDDGETPWERIAEVVAAHRGIETG
jgi:hypothetical protein